MKKEKHNEPQGFGGRETFAIKSLLIAGFFLAGTGLFLFVKKREFDLKLHAQILESLPSFDQVLKQEQLLGTILRAIQANYVDGDRLTEKNVLYAFLEKLSEITESEFSMVSETTAKIKKGDQSIEIQASETEQTEHLLSHMIRLMSFLEKPGILPESFKNNLDSSAAPGELSLRISTQVIVAALLESLDAHSNFLDKSSYRDLRQGTEGSFGGLGVLVGLRESVLTVIRPIPNSPALRAGVKSKDRIVRINGQPTFGQDLESLVAEMLGSPGSKAQLQILRDGADHAQQMNIEREIIQVDSVVSNLISNGEKQILNIFIESFSSRTGEEVLESVKEARRITHGKLSGIILDLRSNPGGLLDQAVEVSDLFLKEGVIVSTRGKIAEIETAKQGYIDFDEPLVVLMNSESASASEIVAGALQDHQRAIILGETSFGKGSVQTIFELPSEQAIKLTIARYYTPLGRSIQNIGIVPDIIFQPIFRNKENRNLLGERRYSSERFLSNHLASEDTREGIGRDSFQAVQHGYYLSDPTSKDQEQIPLIHDEQKKLALTLFDFAPARGSSQTSRELQRSNHWLALSLPHLRRYLQNKRDEVHSYLKGETQLDWGKTGAANRQLQMAFQVESPAHSEILAGTDLEVKWHLENKSPKPIEHLSLYCHSDVPGFETTEILIPRLEGLQYNHGIAKIKTPKHLSSQRLSMRVGIAVNGEPSLDLSKNISVGVARKLENKLGIAARLVSESGRIPGILEESETGEIEVEILNKGVDLDRQIKFHAVNLYGNALVIPNQDFTISGLGRDQMKTLRFPFKFKSSQNSKDDALLGLQLESTELLQGSYKAWEIPVDQAKAKGSAQGSIGTH